MGNVNYEATEGYKLLGTELGAWLSETTAGNVTGAGVSNDLSATNIDLDATGTVTKAAVETGAELMAWSGFSATDYLTRAYGADLDVTQNVTICAWAKTSSASAQGICGNYSSGADSGGYLLYFNAGGTLWMLARPDSGGSTIAQSTATYNDGNWHFIAGTVDASGNVKLYVDGVLIDTATGANMGQTATLYHVGCYDSGIAPFGGSIGANKVIAGALTAAQIKTIYEAEKRMFKANAVYTQVGVSYDLALSLTTATRSEAIQSNSVLSIGGNQETIFHRRDVSYNCNVNRLALSTLPAIRNFLHSVEQGQTFEFDRWFSGQPGRSGQCQNESWLCRAAQRF